MRREQVMRNCACGVGVHCVSRETRGGGCGAGRFLRHGHASRHSPALEGKRQEKRASDVRLAGCDYVVAWLRERGSWERGAVGIVREGRCAVRGCVAGLKRRLLRGSGWVIMDLFSRFGMFWASRRLGMLRQAWWMCMEISCCHWV